MENSSSLKCPRGLYREKWVNGGCPAMKLLQGITQTKSLCSWRILRFFCTVSLNLTHPLASPFFPALISSLLPAVTLHKADLFPLFLIFPLCRSSFICHYPLSQAHHSSVSHAHTQILKTDYDHAWELVFLKAASNGINGKGTKML